MRRSALLLRRCAAPTRRRLGDAAVPSASPTIDESVLKFEMRTYIHGGRKLPIPEAHRIGEYKVKVSVHADDLGLDDLARAKLAYLAGPRFDGPTRTLTLTAERFPSRVENRRYLVHQLQLLKAAAEDADAEFDDQWRTL
jgi:hypothetical protein